MKGYLDEKGYDRAPCSKCKFYNKRTVEVPCYNCISIIDLALHKPNYESEFMAYEPKEDEE